MQGCIGLRIGPRGNIWKRTLNERVVQDEEDRSDVVRDW